MSVGRNIIRNRKSHPTCICLCSKMSNHLQHHMNVQRWHGELRTLERDAGKEADLRLFAVTLTHQIRSCIKLECRRRPRPRRPRSHSQAGY